MNRERQIIRERPADIIIEGLYNGKESWIDVGITSTSALVSQARNVDKIKILAAAHKYHNDKWNEFISYKTANVVPKNVDYNPMIAQTDGSVTQTTKDIIAQLARLLSTKKNTSFEIEHNLLRQNFIAIIIKGNANCVLAHYDINN